MSRVIKFRAWDGDKKEMHLPEFSEKEDFHISAEGHILETHECGYERHELTSRRPDTWVLMQFTGLLDKDGKDIYEGDILKSFPYMRLDDTVIISEVKFDDRRGQWITFSQKYSESEYLFEALKELHETEVIGNIYESPNLLAPEPPTKN